MAGRDKEYWVRWEIGDGDEYRPGKWHLARFAGRYTLRATTVCQYRKGNWPVDVIGKECTNMRPREDECCRKCWRAAQ